MFRKQEKFFSCQLVENCLDLLYLFINAKEKPTLKNELSQSHKESETRKVYNIQGPKGTVS